MVQKVGTLPEFTSDETPEQKEEEVKTEEKDTPSNPPEEKPAETEKVAEETKEPEQTEAERAINALQKERAKLLKEISELKGTRRDIKQEKLKEVEQNIDDLKDVNPDDVSLIDRVLRSKGYMTKEEANRMFYETVKQETLDKFLSKYPEYRPENDPDDTHWLAFQRQIEKEKELGYSLPKNPHLINDFLERVHRELQKTSGVSTTAKQRQVQLAGVGGGGTQPSASPKSLDSKYRTILERGGWTEADIKKIESQLPD